MVEAWIVEASEGLGIALLCRELTGGAGREPIERQ